MKKFKNTKKAIALTSMVSMIAGSSAFTFATESVSLPKEVSAAESSKLKNLQFLSDMKPTVERVGWDRLRKDEGLEGKGKIRFYIEGKETTFDKGIVAHAPATLEYDIPSNVNLFETWLGVATSGRGELSFHIYLDGEEVYNSHKLNKNGTKHIILNVEGKKHMKIYVDPEGGSGSDHSALGDAKFYQKDVSKVDTSLLKEDMPKFSFDSFDKKDYIYNEAKANFLKNAGKVNLYTYMVENPKNNEFLEWFLSNSTMLNYYQMTYEPKGNNISGFLTQLKRIVDADPTVKYNAENQKLAMAVALEFAQNDISLWVNRNRKADAVVRYKTYRDLRNAPGELMPIFNTLDVTQLRNVVGAQLGDDDLIWIRDKIKTEHPELLKSNSALSNATYKYIAYNPFNKYGDNVQKSGYYGENPTFETVIELGGVCGTVSKFDVLVLNAFGVPANIIGQPGHAAVVYMTDNGSWDRNNNISSWGKTRGGLVTKLAKNSHGFNGSYNLLDAEARRNPENYKLAERYFAILKNVENKEERTAIQEKILELVPLYAPVYFQKVKDVNHNSPVENHDLAIRIIKTFSNYPKVMKDLLDPVMKELSKDESSKINNRPLIVDIAIEYDEFVDTMNDKYAKDVYQEEEYQKDKLKYRNILGTFSFSGENANRIWGSKVDTEYSIDGGVTWVPITNENQLLTSADADKITVSNGLRLRLKGIERSIKLPFTSKSVPDSVKADDLENRIVGLNKNMEYSVDGGKSYIDGSIVPELSGNKDVIVRYKRYENNIIGQTKTLHFTANDKVYTQIKKSNIKLVKWSSQQNSSSEAANNVLDGNTKSIWHTKYSRGDLHPTLEFEFNKEYTVKELLYLPRQDSGTNGDMLEYEIFTSKNGKDWTKSATGSVDYTNHKSLKKLKLEDGKNKAKYIRLVMVKGRNQFGSAAEIGFEIPENEAILAEKEIKSNYKKETEKAIINEAKLLKKEVEKSIDNLNSSSILRDEFNELLKNVDNVISGKDVNYSNLTDLRKQLNTLRDKIVNEELKSSIVNESAALKLYKKNNESVIEPSISDMSLSQISDVKKAIDEFSKLDKKDRESYNYILVNLKTKEEYIKTAEESEQFKAKYKNLLDLTLENVKMDNFNDLTTAYYNIDSLSIKAQSILSKEKAHLKSLIDGIKNNKNNIESQAKKFKDSYSTVLSMTPDKIDESNKDSISIANTEALQNFKLLPESVKKLLEKEKKLLDDQKIKLKDLEKSVSRERLKKLIQENNIRYNNMEYGDLVDDAWKDALESAKQVLDSTDSTKARLDDAIVKLLEKMDQCDRVIFDHKDNVKRAKEFKETFKDLLAKNPDNIGLDDKKIIEKAKDKFRRLNSDTQTILIDEREKLNLLEKKIADLDNSTEESGDEKLKNVLANINNYMKNEALTKYKDRLEALLEKGKNVKAEDKMDVAISLDNDFAKIVSQNQKLREDINNANLALQKVRNMTINNVITSDKTDIEEAEKLINKLPTDVKDEVNEFTKDKTLVEHIKELKKKLEEIKDSAEYDKLQNIKANAIADIKGIDGLSQKEKYDFIKKCNEASSEAEVNQILIDSQSKSKSNKDELNKKKEKIIEEIKSVFENANIDSMEPENKSKANDLKAETENISGLTEKTLKNMLQKYQKQMADLVEKDKSDKKIKLEKEKYEKEVLSIKKFIDESDIRINKLPESDKKDLNKSLEDLKIAIAIGTDSDSLNKMKENILSEILKAENKVKNEAAKKAEAEKKAKEEAAKKAEAEKKAKEEAAKKAEAEKKAKEEAAKKAEAEKKAKEEAAKKAEAEKKAKEEAAKKAEAEKKAKEEAAKKAEAEKKAKEEAHAKAVANAQKIIENLDGLTPAEKRDYINQLVNCEVGCDTNIYVDQARELSNKHNKEKLAKEEAHAKAVANAQKIIENLDGLTPEEKKDYINQLVNCEVGCDTNIYVDQARELANKHNKEKLAKEDAHAKAVANAQKIIENLDGLTTEEKRDYINQLVNCEVGCDTNIYVDQARELANKHNKEKLKKEESAKKAEAEKKAIEEAAKKAEAEKKAKEEVAKKAEAEKKAKEEAAKKAEAEKKAIEEAAKKAEAEKKAIEEAAKKAEAEKKAKEESRKITNTENHETLHYVPFLETKFDVKVFRIEGTILKGSELRVRELSKNEKNKFSNEIPKGYKIIGEYEIYLVGSIKDNTDLKVFIPMEKSYKNVIIRHYQNGKVAQLDKVIDLNGNDKAEIRVKTLSPFVVMAKVENSVNTSDSAKISEAKTTSVDTSDTSRSIELMTLISMGFAAILGIFKKNKNSK